MRPYRCHVVAPPEPLVPASIQSATTPPKVKATPPLKQTERTHGPSDPRASTDHKRQCGVGLVQAKNSRRVGRWVMW